MRFGKFLNEVQEEIKEQPQKQHKNADRDSDDLSVQVDNNNIYFYTEVNKASILELNKSLKSVGSEMLHVANVLDVPTPEIKLHINSPGGSLFDGLAAVDYVKKFPSLTQNPMGGNSGFWFVDENGIIYISLIGMVATLEERAKFIHLNNVNNYRKNLISQLKEKAIELGIQEDLVIKNRVNFLF